MGHEVLAETSAVGGVLAARWLVSAAAAAVAAWTDARSRRIPNALTFPVFLAGLGVGAVVGGWNGLGDSAAGALLLFIPYFLLFVFGSFTGGRAGDAKLVTALGAWVGWHGGIVLLVAVAISGAVMGICYAMMKKKLGSVGANLKSTVFGFGLLVASGNGVKEAKDFMPASTSMLSMPYGLAIFVGTLCAAGWVMLWH